MITENVGYNRNTLLEMLKNRIVEVRFRKATGESRTVRGTLLGEYLPMKYRKNMVTPKHENDVITLWDVDEQDWRSVRADRIIDVL